DGWPATPMPLSALPFSRAPAPRHSAVSTLPRRRRLGGKLGSTSNSDSRAKDEENCTYDIAHGRLTSRGSAARCLHVPKLGRKTFTLNEARKRRTSERHRVAANAS